MQPSLSFSSRSPSTASGGSDCSVVRQPKVELCCEICVKLEAKVPFQAIIDAANCWLASSGLTVALGFHCPSRVGVPLLARACSSICIEPANLRTFSVSSQLSSSSSSNGGGGGCNSNNSSKDMNCLSAAFLGSCRSSIESHPVIFPYCQAHITVFPYKLHEGTKECGVVGSDEEEDFENTTANAAATNPLTTTPTATEETTTAATSLFKQWKLPNKEFENIWENLHFEKGEKEILLEYTATALLFSARNVNTKLIAWNRMVLLHGPPGSGKTSLCKGLSQKLAIRLSLIFSSCLFISLNSSALFSRWFSESGKAIVKVFTAIRELLQDKRQLVFIFIDEVESLSLSRTTAAASESPETLRAVNALLTQIDLFHTFPNALILTTSNLAEKLDAAFIDRADLKLYIPSPSVKCRKDILTGCIEELIRTQLLTSNCNFIDSSTEQGADDLAIEKQNKQTFEEIIKVSSGLSGRTLRKMPFLAYGSVSGLGYTPSLAEYLRSLLSAVYRHLDEKSTTAVGD